MLLSEIAMSNCTISQSTNVILILMIIMTIKSSIKRPRSHLYITRIFLTICLFSTAAHADLKVVGRCTLAPQTLSTDTTLGGNTLILADSTNQDIELNLPDADGTKGCRYIIKKTSQFNSVTLTSHDLIDHSPEIILPSGDQLPMAEIVSDGHTWHLLREQSITKGSSNLLISWSFNKTNQNKIHDDSGNGRQGVLNDIALPLDGFCNFPRPDNTKNNIQCSDDLSGDLQQCSVSIWYKSLYSDRTGMQQFVCIGEGNLIIGIKDNGQYHFESNEHKFQKESNGNLHWPDNQWTHLVVTWDDHQKRMITYENGEYLSEISNNDDAFPALQNGLYANPAVTLGSRNDERFRFRGELDDFRLYDYCLSPEEVREVYDLDRR